MRRFAMTRKSQFCFTMGGYHGWLLREDWQAPNRFDTPSPLGCSLALHATTRTSKTFPDVKIEIIITTRMVTNESLTPLPPGASCCCLFRKKISRLHKFTRKLVDDATSYCGMPPVEKEAQQIQCLLVIFVEILSVRANKQLPHKDVAGRRWAGEAEVKMPNKVYF